VASGGSGGSGTSGGSATGSASSIHSDNGFGSSSQVPGVAPTSPRNTSSPRRARASASADAKLGAATDPQRVVGRAAATPSEPRGYLLIALAAAAALGLAAAARVFATRRD
jgi:hypothetical protein